MCAREDAELAALDELARARPGSPWVRSDNLHLAPNLSRDDFTEINGKMTRVSKRQLSARMDYVEYKLQMERRRRGDDADDY